MSHPQRGAFIRGTSVLAALVFVAVLSAIAYGVHSIIPSDPIALGASASLALGPDDVVAPDSSSARAKPALYGSPRCVSPLKEEQSGEAASESLGDDTSKNLCVRGCIYQVSVADGLTKIAAEDRCARSDGSINESCITVYACEVLQCDSSGKCARVGSAGSASFEGYLADKAGVVRIKASPDLDEALLNAKHGSMDAYEQLTPQMKDAFKTEQANIVAANEEKIANNLETIKEMGASNPAVREQLEAETARLQEENRNLSRVTTAVSGDQSSITPGCGLGLTADGECPSQSPDRVPIIDQRPTSDNTFNQPSQPRLDGFGTPCSDPKADPDSCNGGGVRQFVQSGGCPANTTCVDNLPGKWKIPSSITDCPANTTCTPRGTPLAAVDPSDPADLGADDCRKTNSCLGAPRAIWNPNDPYPQDRSYTAQQSDEEYTRGQLGKPPSNESVTIKSTEQPENTTPIRGPMSAQEAEAFRQANVVPGTVRATPEQALNYRRQGYVCRIVTNDISAVDYECTPPSIVPVAPPPQSPINPNTRPDGGGNGPNNPPPSGGGGAGNPFAQDPRANAQLTQDIFKGLIQGLTLGMMFNQSQQSQNPYGAGGYGGYGAYPPPYQQPNNNPVPTLQCPQAPPQPPVASCQGTWQQETLPGPNGQQCVSGWKCNAAASTTAQISCAPLVADAGMQVSISYTCANAAKSAGTNFSINGALSGTASATLSGAATSSVYSVACTNDKNETATASCTVQVAKPAIVLVANPASVEAGAKSTIGWVTSGMQSCVVSSSDSPAFTTQNAGKTATTGSAQTPPLAASMLINLTCQTVGGGTRTASTTVTLK